MRGPQMPAPWMPPSPRRQRVKPAPIELFRQKLRRPRRFRTMGWNRELECRSATLFFRQRIEGCAETLERHRQRCVLLVAVLEQNLSLFGGGAVAAQLLAADIDIGEAGLGKAALEGREQAGVLGIGDELDAARQPDADRQL